MDGLIISLVTYLITIIISIMVAFIIKILASILLKQTYKPILKEEEISDIDKESEEISTAIVIAIAAVKAK